MISRSFRILLVLLLCTYCIIPSFAFHVNTFVNTFQATSKSKRFIQRGHNRLASFCCSSSSSCSSSLLPMSPMNNDDHPSPPHISISDTFDGGNGVGQGIEYDTTHDEWRVSVHIRPDPFTLYEQKHHFQYFSFRSTVSSSILLQGPITIRYMITNAGQASYPQAWKKSTTFVSTTPFDPFSWTRKLDTIYDENTGFLSWTHTHEPHSGKVLLFQEESSSDIQQTSNNSTSSLMVSSSSAVYFAYFPPYSYQRHLNLVSCISSLANSNTIRRTTSAPMAVYSLGQTLDGREIDCIQMGTGSSICWMIHRQHPGETMAEFYAEGLLQRLLGWNHVSGDSWMTTTTTTVIDSSSTTTSIIQPQLDAITQQVLQLYTFYIIPNMNVDGSVRGYLRTNAGGQNLNREWTSSTYIPENKDEAVLSYYEAPTVTQSPEVYYVHKKIQQTGVDVFLDVHGDEELPFNFVSGAEGCITWSPRMEGLQGLFLGAYCRANPDIQKEVSYDPELPGTARINVASNYIANQYNCLALTLEMPFKDCYTCKDPIYGWNPIKSKKLGASVLDALLYVHPFLRDYETDFWNKTRMKPDDVYVRPSSQYHL